MKISEKELIKSIDRGVKAVYDSDNFKNYLKITSHFHNYSFNNIMLILSQYPNASLVAGYCTWKNSFNRQVKKGAKAIRILAPCRYKIESDNDEESDEILYFKIVNVFDVSQTVGDPLPTLTTELKGDSIEAHKLINIIKDLCEYPIIFKDKESDEILKSGARGYFDNNHKKIVIDNSLENIQMAKTLAHEYFHSILHIDVDKSYKVKEIEAESLAYILCHYFGVDTSEYSFPYIASYAKDDSHILKNILIDIQTTAHETIDKIERMHMCA